MTRGMGNMTIGEMLAVLKRKDQDLDVMYDFVHFRPDGCHSYRGYYEDLALGYKAGGDMKVGQLVALLDGAMERPHYGYKGGEYSMHSDTPVWVANHNEAGGTGIVDIEDGGWCIRLITKCID